MNIIFDFFNWQMPLPVMWKGWEMSWFHYLSLTIVILLAIYFSIRLIRYNTHQTDRFILTITLILWVFEIGKQVLFSYQGGWTYPWYIFPFQFCSTPLYIGFIASLSKNKWIKESSYGFLATFVTFSGLAVMLYPEQVFITTVYINIQTMVHHGLMFVLGISLLVSKVSLSWKTFFNSSVIFLILSLIAILLNEAHFLFINEGTFNMFFLNPRYTNHLPILTLIQPLVSPIIFVMIYVIAFSLIGGIMLMLRFGVGLLFGEKQSKLIKNSSPHY